LLQYLATQIFTLLLTYLHVAGSSPGWAPLHWQATYTSVPLSPSSIGTGQGRWYLWLGK